MSIITCSHLISFYGRLEEKAISIYEKMYKVVQEEVFSELAQENKKYKRRVERAYREVITDAIEACFIKGMKEEDYLIDVEIHDGITYRDALKTSVEIEEITKDFCLDAVEGSEGLLMDITRAFERVAKDKEKRIQKLKMNGE
jgi:hypothetical protein